MVEDLQKGDILLISEPSSAIELIAKRKAKAVAPWLKRHEVCMKV